MGAVIVAAGTGAAPAATVGPTTQLSPDMRPVLVLQAPQGELMLVHHAVLLPQRTHLPSAWRTAAPDRGFSQALLMQLSQVSSNWPWRTLVISSSGPESDSQLQTLPGQDAIVAEVHAELVDLGEKVKFHVLMDLVTMRAIATSHETRVRTHVEYFAPALAADRRRPRRNLALFAANGRLDEQVSTAAADLSQFLATIVARVSVPDSLHPHNPTLGELGLHPSCGVCRASDAVVYLQPARVWVRVGKLPRSILALPRPAPSLQPRTR
ncbi:MAG TPA: hypothetical protein VIY90_19840 [Steroidobacteraceae bacterium]